METGYGVESDAKMMAVPNKKKRVGFLKRWVLKAVKEAVTEERRESNLVEAGNVVSAKQIKGLSLGPPNIDQPERAIQFTVYTANGGRIIETRRHDRKTDRYTNGLYIITSDQDFGREIDKIITMEALK